MNKIGICGAGLIGASWAIGFANAGYLSYVYDNNANSVENFNKYFDDLLLDLKTIDPNINEDKIRSNIKLNCTIEQICEKAVLIQESIVEDLKVKQDVYKELDRLTSKETILASSSSYLVISEISEFVEHKNRCINAHPALPPHVVPFVEVVGSQDTSEEIINKALTIYKKANYAAILVKKETEGFVLNRLQGALLNEAVRLHEGGFASMEDIDIALKHALGIRWAFMGPFEIMDLNAPEGIKDSFSRYRTGIQDLAKQQNTVPSYSDEYLDKLDKEQRQRLAYQDRPDRIKKRNQMIALIRKLKLELGEDV